MMIQVVLNVMLVMKSLITNVGQNYQTVLNMIAQVVLNAMILMNYSIINALVKC